LIGLADIYYSFPSIVLNRSYLADRIDFRQKIVILMCCKRLICIACGFVIAVKLEGAPGPTPAPTPNATFGYPIGHLAADPVRPRVYATVPGQNAILVIDTDLLTITNTIPIGPSPTGVAVSANGRKLWVTNSGSASVGIGVVDLNTLETLPSLATPYIPYDVEEGYANQLYVTNSDNGWPDGNIMQIDANSGAFQRSFGGWDTYHNGFLEVTPDRRTLFYADNGTSPTSMLVFNVAATVPSLVQQGWNYGSNGIAINVSHDGRFIVFPNGGGNSGYDTWEIPTADIHGVNGTFLVGAYPVAAVFSNDDTLLYHGTASQGVVKVFDTATFNPVEPIPIGNAPTGYPADVKDLVVDRSGRWLFVATGDFFDGDDLRVFDTGRMDPVRPAQLGNISTRMQVLTDENVLIGGFIINGTGPKRVIVRGIGPSLAQVIPGSLADPMLELYEGATLLVSNDNWKSDQQAEIEATGVAPTNDLESAIVRTLSPGAYTVIMRGTNSNIGTGLVEVYDLDRSSDSQLENISTRGFIDTGDNVMIGGIIIPPTYASIRVIVRAIGPSLEAFGVQDALQDPTLELHDASGTTVASNDDWRVSDTGGSQEADIEATTLSPTDDRESALVRQLAPGNYTAIVRGKNNTTGVGLVEVYNLPNQF
jgi:DNA-binding beta-propeller fold protein YncE